MELLLLAAAVVAYVAWQRREARPTGARPGRRRPPGRGRAVGGAGASAAARAAVLRRQARGGLGRQALAALGLDREGERYRAAAARWEAGAAGERQTAAQLEPLRRDGWHILHDRKLPQGRANVDHLVISPGGVVFMPDTKQWSRKWRVDVVRGRLHHGTRDQQKDVDSALYEARTVAEVLGVPVVPLLVIRGAPVTGGELVVRGVREAGMVRVIPAAALLGALRAGSGRPARTRAAALARRARVGLPPYRGA